MFLLALPIFFYLVSGAEHQSAEIARYSRDEEIFYSIQLMPNCN